MTSFLWRTATTGLTLWLATLLIPGSMHFEWSSAESTVKKVGIVLIVAVVFGVVNALIKPIVQILSIPFYILTLGLFHIVVNAIMLWLVSWFSTKLGWGLIVDSFWWSAIWAAIIVSIVGIVVTAVTDRVADTVSN